MTKNNATRLRRLVLHPPARTQNPVEAWQSHEAANAFLYFFFQKNLVLKKIGLTFAVGFIVISEKVMHFCATVC